MRPQLLVALVSTVVLFVAGCRSLPSESATTLHKASVDLSKQTAELLDRIDATALETEIRSAVGGTNLLLSPSQFPLPVESVTRAALIQQLKAVERYLDTVRVVASREYRGKIRDASAEASRAFQGAAASANQLGKFANADELKAIQQQAGVITAVFATTAEAWVDVRTQAQARKVIEKTREPFSQYMTQLANVFSKTDDEAVAAQRSPSLATILGNEFQARMGSLNRQWLQLGPQPSGSSDREKWSDRREKLARAYVATQRGAELSPAVAVGLRKACLSIAEEHAALVEPTKGGTNPGRLSDLESTVARLQFLVSVFDDVQKATIKNKD